MTHRIRLTTTMAPGRFHALATVPALPPDVARSWVQMLKVGDFYDPRYDSFSVTPDTLTQILQNFDRLQRAVAGDYDHGAAFGSTEANAWVEQLQLRADGLELWAEVAWLPDTADAIRAGKWRYISPEFSFSTQAESGENVGAALLGFALTNRPFLEGMQEVSLMLPAGAPISGGTLLYTITSPPVGATTEEPQMDPKLLARALGLPEDTDEAVMLGRARELGDASRVVLSRDDHQALLSRAQAGDEAVEASRVLARDALVDAAVKDGRLAPALADAMRLSYDAAPEATRASLDALPVNPAFKPAGASGEKALSVVPPVVDSDSPRSDQVHALALSKQQDQPGLSYHDAVKAADREVPRPTIAA